MKPEPQFVFLRNFQEERKRIVQLLLGHWLNPLCVIKWVEVNCEYSNSWLTSTGENIVGRAAFVVQRLTITFWLYRLLRIQNVDRHTIYIFSCRIYEVMTLIIALSQDYTWEQMGKLKVLLKWGLSFLLTY